MRFSLGTPKSTRTSWTVAFIPALLSAALIAGCDGTPATPTDASPPRPAPEPIGKTKTGSRAAPRSIKDKDHYQKPTGKSE